MSDRSDTSSSDSDTDPLSRSVLIVDDEPSIVAPLKFLMQQQGHSVRVVTTGEEVVPAMEKDRPDLVLLDVMLPEVTGYELCETIRGRGEWRDVKIIMLTVKSREADIEKGRALGADAYITKPFGIQDVLDTARRLLDPS
ncbi:two-component system response regulator [Longibacter salinarum]|uniref:Two-component system response regulator n=1 Tax=Longibacter salinarum TaxID=1850348 RepID=A0A2A8CVT7_9BACT|nr:response regulator [Longibacter salinarum]PEN12869.1 two-component system response regulator [Longibacter salinarum]